MEYLPDVYQHFERAFPHVQPIRNSRKPATRAAPSTSERRGSSSSESLSARRRREPSAPMRAARSARARAVTKCATSACLP